MEERKQPNEVVIMVLAATTALARLFGWVAVILLTFVAAVWGFGIGWAILGGAPGLVTGLIGGLLGAVLLYKGMAWFVRYGLNVQCQNYKLSPA